MTWVAIVKYYLKDKNFDCLQNDFKKCYCKHENLFNCAFDSSTFECIAGNIKKLPSDYTLWDEN